VAKMPNSISMAFPKKTSNSEWDKCGRAVNADRRLS
jgi:hypothetical protein